MKKLFVFLLVAVLLVCGLTVFSSADGPQEAELVAGPGDASGLPAAIPAYSIMIAAGIVFLLLTAFALYKAV